MASTLVPHLRPGPLGITKQTVATILVRGIALQTILLRWWWRFYDGVFRVWKKLTWYIIYSTTICKLVDLIPALRQSDCRIPNWVSAKTVLSCSTNHGQTTARFRPAQLVLCLMAVPPTPAQTVSWSIPISSPHPVLKWYDSNTEYTSYSI